MQQRAHLGILDLLRGAAALAVVLYHFSLPAAEMSRVHFPALSSLFGQGYLGVNAFFVISGFVIPLSLWNGRYAPAMFLGYLRRRMVRLVPPAYVSMLLLLLHWAAADLLVHHRPQLLGTVSAGRLLSNALFVAPFTASGWINPVFWTLTVEFEFYIVLGLLFPLLFGAGRFWLFLVAHAAMLALARLPGLHMQNYFHYSALFAMGGATLLFYKARLPVLAYLGTLAVFGGLAWLGLGYWEAGTGAATALAIAFVRVDNPVSRFLGRVSYSLYLTHTVVGAVVSFGVAYVWPPASDWQRAAVVGLAVGLSVGFAALYYRCIERPFHQLAQRLPRPAAEKLRLREKAP
jgi:peptidoglycan/LPS O-acetylase OafA/YrhL